MKTSIFYIMFLLLPALSLDAQEQVDNQPLPKVFLIGEYEDKYGDLYEEYNEILLTVCDNNMNLAFDRWMDMINEMEEYAKSIEYDINGVKVWLKLFWAKDGAIDHISYFLKPDSRNINRAELSAFFSSFINNYKLPVTSSVKFTHNGSAQFPVGMPPPTSRR